MVDKNTLLQIIEIFRINSYFLASINCSSNCKVTTKKRIPQPSKKKVEEDDLSKRVQFCSGALENTGDNFELIKKLVFPDFISDIPDDCKKLVLLNNYKFTEILIPKNVKNSLLLRIMAIRKGIMTRSLDGELYEKQYKIIV